MILLIKLIKNKLIISKTAKMIKIQTMIRLCTPILGERGVHLTPSTLPPWLRACIHYRDQSNNLKKTVAFLDYRGHNNLTEFLILQRLIQKSVEYRMNIATIVTRVKKLKLHKSKRARCDRLIFQFNRFVVFDV